MFEKFRRRNRDLVDPFIFLARLEQFFEESKRDLEIAIKPVPSHVVVVRRDLNLAKPVNLLAGVLILALGVGLGRWFKDPVMDPETAGSSAPMVQAAELKPDTVLVINPEPPASSFPTQHSSSDTLLLEVRKLLERVKRGE